MPEKPVIIMPYDSQWPVVFESLKQVYQSMMNDIVIAIEHVGSTAVPGLASKPIIDIDLVIPSREQLFEAILRLAALGYHHQGDLGVPGREAFSRKDAMDVPKTGNGRI